MDYLDIVSDISKYSSFFSSDTNQRRYIAFVAAVYLSI